MKKIAIAMSLLLAFGYCSSVDRTKVGGKEVVTATQSKPVIFTGLGAPVTACLDELNTQGVTTVTNANGAPTGGLFSSSRISGTESCQATGVK